MASSHLQWLLIRNNSSFIVKGAHNQTFTTEPNNLKGKNSFRFNGLVHNKTVGVSATSDKKGVVLSTRNQSGRNKPAKSLTRVTFKNAAGQRRVLDKIRTTLKQTRYRKDLKTAALRHASALLNGQRVKTAAPAAAAAAATTEKKSK